MLRVYVQKMRLLGHLQAFLEVAQDLQLTVSIQIGK